MTSRQRRNSGGRSTEQLSTIPEQQSISGDFQRPIRSMRYDTRSSRSQSRSSVIENRTPRSEMGDSTVQEKNGDEFHEKTKDALSSLIVRKDELESNGIETEMMYKELMSCVSPWRRKKLQQEASDSQSALVDALKNADELMAQAKSAFEGYQSMHDPKRREAAAGDLFWKAKVMHKTLTACVQVACNAESARDQLAWADKMGKLMNTMMAIFRIMDDLKQNLTKERALTSTLTALMQKHGHTNLFTVEGLNGCGEEADIALLLARAGVNKAPPPPPSLLQRLQTAIYHLPPPVQAMAAGAVCSCLLWAMFAPHLNAAEVVDKVLSAPRALLRSSEEPSSLVETLDQWLASLVYSLLCWLPGVCGSGQPATSLWAIAQKFSPI